MSEEQIRRNAIIREHGTEEPKVNNNTYDEGVLSELVLTTPTLTPAPSKNSIPQSALKNTTIQPRSSNFMERGLFG